MLERLAQLGDPLVQVAPGGRDDAQGVEGDSLLAPGADQPGDPQRAGRRPRRRRRARTRRRRAWRTRRTPGRPACSRRPRAAAPSPTRNASRDASASPATKRTDPSRSSSRARVGVSSVWVEGVLQERAPRRRCRPPALADDGRALGDVDPVDRRRHPVQQLEGQAEARVGVAERVHPLVAHSPRPPTPPARAPGRPPGASAGPPRRRPREAGPSPGSAPRRRPGAAARAPPAAARRTRPPGRRGGGTRCCRRPGSRPRGRRWPRGAGPRRPPRLDVDGAGEQRDRRDPADHRRGPQQPAGVARQVLHPRPQQLVQRRRAAVPGRRPRGRSCSTKSGFPAERSSVSSSRSGGSGPPASSVTSRTASARSRRGTSDPLRRQPAQLRQPGAEGARLVGRVLAVGQQEQHPLVGEVGGQEGQQVQRRPVRPVQVLHDVHHRPLGAHPAEQAEHRLEQAQPRGLARPGARLRTRLVVPAARAAAARARASAAPPAAPHRTRRYAAAPG